MRFMTAAICFLTMTLSCVAPGWAGTGTVSGHLQDPDGNAVSGYRVSAYAVKQQGGGNPVALASSDASGNFTITNVPEGVVYIQAAGASASNNYQWMYWDGLAGSTDYTTSAPVTVPSGGGATGVNMTLQRGGTVVATFVDAVTGNPVQGIGLLLYPGSACNTQNLPSFPGSAGSNQISVYGVPPGTVYVRPWTNDSSLSYIFPWWNGGDGSGTMNCSEAVGIPVQVGQTAGPLNYRLTLGGKITGTVTNGQGAPVANMNLYAFTGSPCGQTTQAAYAYTNQSGEYSLVVPAGSAYSVKVYDYNTRTYVPLWWDGTAGSSNCANAQVVAATSGGTTPGINFTMQPGGSIVGTVKDAANQGIAGVTVQVYDARGFYINQVTTDAQGAYTVTGVTPGLALVYANGTSNSLNYLRKWWDGGTGDINRYRATAVTVAASTPTTGLNFVLEPGGTVGGTITDHTGAPLAGISIRAYAGAPMNSIGNFASATTNASGAYTLRGMPAQTFIEANIGSSGINAVSAWWNGSGGVFGPFNARPLAVAPGATLSGIDMQLAQGGVIEGRITNGTGTGLPGVSVAAFMEMACSPSQASSATTDADGEFTLVGVPAGKAHVAGSGGNYIPTWWNGAGGAAKYADSAAVTVVAGQTVSDVTVPLPLGGAISGTVLDAGGHPLYGVILSTVSQACASVPPATGYSAVSYADGTFTLGGVPAGATYVKTSPALRRTDHAVTWYDGGTGTSACGGAQGVTVASGETTSGVNMTTLHGGIIGGTLTGAGEAGLNCVPVLARTDTACQGGNYSSTALSIYDGTYTLYGVPAGSAYVGTYAAATSQRLQDQYWNGTKGVGSCSQAAGLTVTGGTVIGGIDMTLPAVVSNAACINLLINGNN